MSRRLLASVVLVVPLVGVVVVVVPAGAARAAPLVWSPPVEAPVQDGFRAPSHPYGSGNRGLEYRTTPGMPARAVADGVVGFAGPVAGRPVVSVDHADGRRSSLTGLATVAVSSGARVQRGDVLGTTGATLHLGVREGEVYLDPAALFARARGELHLVPPTDPGVAPPPPATQVVPAAPEAHARPARLLAAASCPPACKRVGRG